MNKVLTEAQVEKRASSLATYVVGSITTVLAIVFAYQMNVEYKQQLREKQRAQLIIQSAPSAVIMCDESGTIIEVNRTAEEMFGMSDQYLVGQKSTILIPDEDVPAHLKGMEASAKRVSKLVNDGNWMVSTDAIKLHGKHKDGHILELKASIRVIKLADGKIQFITYLTEPGKATEREVSPLPPEIQLN